MKLTSLFSTLAFLLFAVTASAQSDPSTGGSFGTSFNHNVVTGGALAGTASIGQDASMTAPLPTQTRPTFWSRITGRSRSTAAQAQSTADKTGQRRVWFGPQGTNIRSRSWSQNHDNAHNNKRPAALKTTTSASTRSSGWHLFGRR